MKINKEQLVSLLSDRTGMDRGDVNRQFVELIGRIQQAEENRDTLEIEGFGTFVAVQDRLEFVPARLLETEINNRYAGMKPIELIGAFREPEMEEAEPAAGRKEPIPQAGESSESPEEKEEADAIGAEGEMHTQETVSDAPAVPDEVESLDADRADDPDDAVPAQAEEKPSVPEKDELVADAVSDKEPADRKAALPSREEDPIGRIITIIIAILILAIAGWLAYDAGLFGQGESGKQVPSEATQEQQANVNPPAARPEGNEAVPESPESESGQENTAGPEKEDNDQATSAVENSPYGLYGSLNTDLKGGYYTIVVHSMRTMPLAEEKAGDLQGNNYRIKIKESAVNGQTYFRVGLGQFETVKAAQEAARNLPEPIKTENFISRF